MARQLIIAVLLLLGLGAIHTAGTHRALAPKPSDDPYAWLGPVPKRIDDQELRQRWDRLGKRMVSDAQAVDVRQFACKSPSEIGTLPMMSSVMRYIHDLPGSEEDETLASGLSQAAARGNWLARTLMLSPLTQQDDMQLRYRAVQLAEWLYVHRLGQLFSELEYIGTWYGANYAMHGNDPSGFIAAAAIRQDYAAQASIGNELIRANDPALVSAGGKMLTCAAEARVFYESMSGASDLPAIAQAPVHMAKQSPAGR